MKIELDLHVDIGDKVRYKNRAKDEGYVLSINIRGTGPAQRRLRYEVIWSDKKSEWHDDFEIEKIN